jgi:hypothetical protein
MRKSPIDELRTMFRIFFGRRPFGLLWVWRMSALAMAMAMAYEFSSTDSTGLS